MAKSIANKNIKAMFEADEKQMTDELLRLIMFFETTSKNARREGLLSLANTTGELPPISDSIVDKGLRSIIDGSDFSLIEKRLQKWKKFFDIRYKVVAEELYGLNQGDSGIANNMLARIPEPFKTNVIKLYGEKSL